MDIRDFGMVPAGIRAGSAGNQAGQPSKEAFNETIND
jgi:hypothetical protein